MTRKQHIETLTRFSDPCNEGITYTRKQLIDAIKYAIDHLSREWGSRKTHRKLQIRYNMDISLMDKLEKECVKLKSEIDKLKSEYFHANKFSVRFKLETENKALKSEIDHLKADKAELKQMFDAYADGSRGQMKSWANDLKEESDKVSSLQNKVKWLSITTAILFIVLLFALFNCC